MAVAIALAATACTTAVSVETTTTVADTTTSSEASTTTNAPTTTTAATPLVPPTTPDKSEIALDVLVDVDGYTVTDDRTGPDLELFALFDAWLPVQIIDGAAASLVVGPDGERVAVLSTIPVTGLRGDPNAPAIFAISAGRGETEAVIVDGITTIDAASGGSFDIWSDGDGVLIAIAEDAATSHMYMVARAALDGPNDVWASDSCLYLAPNEVDFFGVYPYAPFTTDLVVPCNGPHNAEVLRAALEGTTAEVFDAEAIQYQRNYECDREYQETFGASVKEHRASLVTYMPDEDEWDRGDRYLACVAVLFDDQGEPVLIDGDMADQANMEVVISPGDCTDGSISNVVDCSSIHSQQYVGSALFPSDTYPTLGDEAFDELCAVYEPDLTESSGADVRIAGLGLMPYSFELGDREVRCYATAIVDGFLPVDVVGSFFGRWSVVDEDATAA